MTSGFLSFYLSFFCMDLTNYIWYSCHLVFFSQPWMHTHAHKHTHAFSQRWYFNKVVIYLCPPFVSATLPFCLPVLLRLCMQTVINACDKTCVHSYLSGTVCFPNSAPDASGPVFVIFINISFPGRWSEKSADVVEERSRSGKWEVVW